MNNKELKSLLKILRLNGVSKYSTSEINIELDKDFFIHDRANQISTEGQETVEEEIPTDELTGDDLIYYSVNKGIEA